MYIFIVIKDVNIVHRGVRFIRLCMDTQTSAVSEHANKTGHFLLWNQVKFIDRDPHRYTRRVKEAIHIRLHSNNINRDNGIEIPLLLPAPFVKDLPSRFGGPFNIISVSRC